MLNSFCALLEEFGPYKALSSGDAPSQLTPTPPPPPHKKKSHFQKVGSGY